MNSLGRNCALPVLLAGLLAGGFVMTVCRQMAGTRARDVDHLLKAKTWMLLRLAYNGPMISEWREEVLNIVDEKLILQMFDKERKLVSA